MKRVFLSDNISVSRIAYGMWRLCDDKDNSPERVIKKLETCLESGITTIDQADIYGEGGSEELFGVALGKTPEIREKLEIITKCNIKILGETFPERKVKSYDTSSQYITKTVETSLSKMKTDYIDLLLLHRPDPFMNHNETGLTLDKLVDSGKIRSVGVSNFRPWDWDLLQSAMKHKLVTNQIEISVKYTEPFINGDIAFLQKLGKPVMAWSPMGGGSLFETQDQQSKRLLETLSDIAGPLGCDISTIALSWLISHPAEIIPVIGTNNIQRITEASKATDFILDRETWFEVYTASIGADVP
ncbi:MAG: oxidoreductase [Rickettsiales bacterium]|nr:oxidoreductase [Rickettsiales bacterium]